MIKPNADAHFSHLTPVGTPDSSLTPLTNKYLNNPPHTLDPTTLL